MKIFIPLVGFLISLCSSFDLSAQDSTNYLSANKKNFLSIAPKSLTNEILVSYERILISRFSLGITGSYSHNALRYLLNISNVRKRNLYGSVQVEPFVRVYFNNEKNRPLVFFIQPKGIYGNYWTEMNLYFDNGSGYSESHQKVRFSSFGGGANVGFKYRWKEHRYIAELSIGLQYLPYINKDFSVTRNGIVYSSSYNNNGTVVRTSDYDNDYWYTFGPGGIISNTFTMGISF